jgi:hypothetical protein
MFCSSIGSSVQRSMASRQRQQHTIEWHQQFYYYCGRGYVLVRVASGVERPQPGQGGVAPLPLLERPGVGEEQLA